MKTSVTTSDPDPRTSDAAEDPVPRSSAIQSPADLMEKYGISLNTLQAMYRDWKEGKVPKSVVEARYLRTRRFHGKLFSRLVLAYLGIQTEHPHPLRNRIEELEREVAYLRQVLEQVGVSAEPGRPHTPVSESQLALDFDPTAEGRTDRE
jgi:hypothetical protein